MFKKREDGLERRPFERRIEEFLIKEEESFLIRWKGDHVREVLLDHLEIIRKTGVKVIS